VFDISNKEGFEKLEKLIKDVCPKNNQKIILAGGKADLEHKRKVSIKDGEGVY
jgi:hypothetical protein